MKNAPHRATGRPVGRKIGSQSAKKISLVNELYIVYEQLGGSHHFLEWAKENPTDFYKILAKLIPAEMIVKNDTSIKVIINRGEKPVIQQDQSVPQNNILMNDMLTDGEDQGSIMEFGSQTISARAVPDVVKIPAIGGRTKELMLMDENGRTCAKMVDADLHKIYPDDDADEMEGEWGD